ncbi:DUF986 family protein [Pantoea sp. A4]|uniref:DUF986 family protein n=1 Tax=Pantoea sp. A4 TaxID=1225184 RepID=UPI00037BBEDD|nr:DUF986 family protein [Pantoea sp. A4]
MDITQLIIAALIALMALFIIYDELVLPRRYGVVRLRVDLRRRQPLDGLIFIGLLAIVLWNNLSQHGPQLTTTLLMVLCALALWVFWIRRPRLWLKDQGLFYAGVWIAYTRIQDMKLSEDGVLVIQLEQRRLLVRVRQIDDLERIWQTLMEIR